MNHRIVTALLLAINLAGFTTARSADDGETFYLKNGRPQFNPRNLDVTKVGQDYRFAFNFSNEGDSLRRLNMITIHENPPLFKVHEHEERKRELQWDLQWDWDFRFTFAPAQPPTELRPGESFTMRLQGRVSGGQKQEGNGYAFIGVQTWGFEQAVDAKAVVGRGREDGLGVSDGHFEVAKRTDGHIDGPQDPEWIAQQPMAEDLHRRQPRNRRL